MYGLNQSLIDDLITIFSNFQQIDKVVLYGSRAKGNYRKGSDIDLSFFGETLNLNAIFKIQDKIEDLDSPYLFDLSIFHQIDNPDLIDHIKRIGIEVYNADI
ncbi:MAG: hypothetical protein COB02_10200 [Candidatus Cloacimonadota bacterium]|nr:MAG: hypothetical protein COB02_10200 [Candidatus Cloacimonadota bacterium]